MLTRATVAVSLVLALACTKKNPKYCDDNHPCASGQCNSTTKECSNIDAGADRAEVGDAADARDATDAVDARDAVDLRPHCTDPQCADGGFDGAFGVCEPDAGVCVGCLRDTDCMAATKPICNLTTRVCEPCMTDAQCAAKIPNPGVCMSHLDGHCASDDETIYVKNSAGCTMTAGAGGTRDVPYCLSQDGINAAVMQGRALVIMRGPDTLTEWSVTAAPTAPLTVVGQSAATVSPGARIGVHVSSGKVFVRQLTVSGGTNVGVVVDNSAELHMDRCAVMSNSKGGILLNGALFDIENTSITNNGPGTTGSTNWGGIFVNNPPAAGPKRLNLLTVQNNLQVGVTCSEDIAAMTTGVLASGNTGGEVNQTCGFTSCGAPSATCGAPQ